jgi:CRISPR/Cas system CMR-associated protein Cmr1 (group 7 of RAMP superfamily)
MIEIANIAIAGLSALGALVQAYSVAKANNENVSKSKIKKSKERADKPLKIGAKKVSEVIDDKLLLVLKRKIEEQHTKLIQSLESTSISDSERERSVEEAKNQICYFLKKVKEFNEGALPTKRLENLWLSNKCTI